RAPSCARPALHPAPDRRCTRPVSALPDGVPLRYAAPMNLITAMRYLVALDQHGHFGRAAAACHVSQPALSNALRALEKEFGVAIVKRSRVYGGLTPEGEAVLATAQRTLRDIELLARNLRDGEA